MKRPSVLLLAFKADEISLYSMSFIPANTVKPGFLLTPRETLSTTFRASSTVSTPKSLSRIMPTMIASFCPLKSLTTFVACRFFARTKISLVRRIYVDMKLRY